MLPNFCPDQNVHIRRREFFVFGKSTNCKTNPRSERGANGADSTGDSHDPRAVADLKTMKERPRRTGGRANTTNFVREHWRLYWQVTPLIVKRERRWLAFKVATTLADPDGNGGAKCPAKTEGIKGATPCGIAPDLGL